MALLTALALAGCGSTGEGMEAVSGTVTYKGKPVTTGMISFQPVDPKGRVATSAIGPDGSYTLQTENPSDGALPGQYTVVISAIQTDEGPPPDFINPKAPKPKSLIPAKYGKPTDSGLTATVNEGESNVIPFDLKD